MRPLPLLGWLTLFLLGACSSAPPSRPLVVSLAELSCDHCESDLGALLTPLSGVQSREFRQAHAELHLRYDPRLTTSEALLQVLRQEGYRAERGAGLGYYRGSQALPAFGDVAWVETAEWEEIGVPGKITVLQQDRLLCAPCDAATEVIAAFLKEGEQVALRRLRTEESTAPYAIVFDDLGNVVDRLPRADPDRLKHAIEVAHRL